MPSGRPVRSLPQRLGFEILAPHTPELIIPFMAQIFMKILTAWSGSIREYPRTSQPIPVITIYYHPPTGTRPAFASLTLLPRLHRILVGQHVPEPPNQTDKHPFIPQNIPLFRMNGAKLG